MPPLFQHYSLRTAHLLLVIVPVAVLIATASWFALANLEHHAEVRMQEDIELVARAIQLPLSDALERERPGSLQQTLDSAFQIDRVYGAYVYDGDGELVASSGPFNPRMTSRREARAVTESGSHGEFADRGGQEVFSYFVPLSDTSGQINGLLQVTRHGNDFRHYLGQLRTLSLPLTILAVLLLTGVVAFGHHRAVGRSLLNLESAMTRIRSGERSHRVPKTGPVEIRNLAGAMNTTLDAIDESQRLLERGQAEQHALEQRLQQAEKMAAIGQLSAGVAHELGTPLNVVDGHAQRIARQSSAESSSAVSAEAIRTEVRRMDHIVRQLMDVGRRNPLDLNPHHASELIRNALVRVAEHAAHASVSIQIQDTDADPLLWVDSTRLEQALVNLVINAIQATPSGNVHIGWFEDDQHAGFVIDDDGPGIPSEQRRHMYEPFFTTKHVGEGTGLGLAVAHGAVSDHEGELDACDSPSGGMRFTIRIPHRQDTQ
jgi:two-component system, NtrC family, sensor kinase